MCINRSSMDESDGVTEYSVCDPGVCDPDDTTRYSMNDPGCY
jgi:hypothetical protein